MAFGDYFGRPLYEGDLIVYVAKGRRALTHATITEFTETGLKLDNPNLTRSSVLRNTKYCTLAGRNKDKQIHDHVRVTKEMIETTMEFTDYFGQELRERDEIVYVAKGRRGLTYGVVTGLTETGLKLRNPKLTRSSVLRNTKQCVIVGRNRKKSYTGTVQLIEIVEE